MNNSSSIINGIEYVKNIQENFINIKIPLSVENQLIIENFFSELEKINLPKIINDWFIDVKNCSIISPKNIFFLTKRELTFIQLLLKNKIVTYDQMNWYLWEGKSDLTQNAIKVFVKNFKKKMPPKIIKNVNSIGYRLEL